GFAGAGKGHAWLTRAVQSGKNTPELLFKKAVESYRGSDYTAAVEACERILQQPAAAGSLAALYNLKALSLAGMGNMVDAVDVIGQAIALDPGQPRLHLHAARLLARLGRYRLALRHLK